MQVATSVVPDEVARIFAMKCVIRRGIVTKQRYIGSALVSIQSTIPIIFTQPQSHMHNISLPKSEGSKILRVALPARWHLRMASRARNLEAAVAAGGPPKWTINGNLVNDSR